jgi:opacity protein-like surface antigen
MKKIIIMATLLSSSLLFATPKNYIDMHYGFLTHSENGTVSDFDMSGFKWTIGRTLTHFYDVELSGEVSAILGVEHEKKSIVLSSDSGTFTDASIALDRLYNMNFRLNKELMDNLALQGYLGVSRAKVTPEALNNNPQRAYRNSLSYGLGASYSFLPEVALNLQYMQYFENLSSLEVGLRFEF